MKIINISNAKSHLSSLIRAVETGEEVIIWRYGKAVAKLVAFKTKETQARKGGQWNKKLWLAKDFQQMPQYIVNSFYGEE